jgi:uncharacterized repeat protein (TIGR03803 family)
MIRAAIRLTLISVFGVSASCSLVPAQETVIYPFSENGNILDGRHPTGLVTFDRSGSLYGVTSNGGGYNNETFQSYCFGLDGCGTVYDLSPSSAGWAETVLYSFCPDGQNTRTSTCPDGLSPLGGLVSDSAGNLYGTTYWGGGGSIPGPGVIFELSPPANGSSLWTETVLHAFGSNGDGYLSRSSLTWGKSGKLYGTTAAGGAYNSGTVFELSPQSGGDWTEAVIHNFGAVGDGEGPWSNVIFDSSGNLYGTTTGGGTAGAGTIFELTRENGGIWAETVLYAFDGTTGSYPTGNVTFGPKGVLYGTLLSGGLEGGCDPYNTCGGVFEYSAGKIRFFLFDGADGGGPYEGVTVDDKTGLVIGTTSYGVTSNGTVFDLREDHINVLYNFCSVPPCADGGFPDGPLVSHGGELYGVNYGGGNPYNGDGVVFEITPGLADAN